ncbi:intraflagellar transport protein 20 homolog isoform X1 [Accipiter gentilis]|uniref:intraflagellar transport protein 20 homolog isoform X1 n=1 Tax=Astur gentilis TaxID=8957 RepID=UPI00211043C1|nr:intraflagellar transport protein 20 homolog isoform X1 [Accipiter gentilis]
MPEEPDALLKTVAANNTRQMFVPEDCVSTGAESKPVGVLSFRCLSRRCDPSPVWTSQEESGTSFGQGAHRCVASLHRRVGGWRPLLERPDEYEQKRGSRRDPGGDSSPIPGGTRRHAERCRCLWGAKAGRGGRHGGNERSYGNDGFYRTSLQNTQCTAPGKPSSVPAVHQGLLLRGPATAGIETERSGPRTSEM